MRLLVNALGRQRDRVGNTSIYMRQNQMAWERRVWVSLPIFKRSKGYGMKLVWHPTHSELRSYMYGIIRSPLHRPEMVQRSAACAVLCILIIVIIRCSITQSDSIMHRYSEYSVNCLLRCPAMCSLTRHSTLLILHLVMLSVVVFVHLSSLSFLF